jgi:signal peptidase I
MKSAAQVWQMHTIQRELAADTLLVSGMIRLKAAGWSMLPAVWPGDTLVVEQMDCTGVRHGEIVAFSRGGRFVAHRIVSEKSGQTAVQTRGDALLEMDSPLSDGDIVGKVVLILRNGRCIVPRRNLSFGERVMAALFRRSPFAVRVAVRLYQALNFACRPNFNNRAVPCQS